MEKLAATWNAVSTHSEAPAVMKEAKLCGDRKVKSTLSLQLIFISTQGKESKRLITMIGDEELRFFLFLASRSSRSLQLY
jgi:hypothetical protein